MRKLLLVGAAVFAVMVFHPGPALAVDDPLWSDGGCLLANPDAGRLYTVNTGLTSSWAMAITCVDRTRYVMCESNVEGYACTTADGGVWSDDGGLILYDGGQKCGPGSCSAGPGNQLLKADVTYDIPVPNGRPYLSANQDDGGILNCCVQRVTP